MTLTLSHIDPKHHSSVSDAEEDLYYTYGLNPNVRCTTEGWRLWTDLVAAVAHDAGVARLELDWARWLTFCATVTLYDAREGWVIAHGRLFYIDSDAPYTVETDVRGDWTPEDHEDPIRFVPLWH